MLVVNLFIGLLKSKLGAGYIWGAPRIIDKPEVITPGLLDWYKRTFGAGHYTQADKWIGHEAFDCSGLIVWALAVMELIKQDYTAAGLYGLCKPVSKEKLQPGDLCFRKSSTIDHVGVYINDGRVLHARGTFYGVVETELFDSFNLFGRLEALGGDREMIDKLLDFQRRHGLIVDGIIGPQTIAKAQEQLEVVNYILNYKRSTKPSDNAKYKKVSLNGTDPSRMPVLRQGSKGKDVEFLQAELKEIGYYAGLVDGDFGPITRAAALALQSRNGLSADGVVGRQTWEHILIAHAMEVDPLNLHGEIIKTAGNKIKGDFANGTFYDMNSMRGIGNLVVNGKVISKQWVMHPDTGEPWDIVRRGNLIVYKIMKLQ